MADSNGAGTDEEKKKDKGYPGALNAGWDYYFQWANTEYELWKASFDMAEKERQDESDRWYDYYTKVYEKDNAWWKKTIMYALNGIQIWALWKQFRQQKKIADDTYNIADRTQRVAEEMFAFYESVYKPQEQALGGQISANFGGGNCVDYSIADRFEQNVRRSFARSKASLTRCSSSHCGTFTPAMDKQWEIETAQAVGNARTGAFRYAELLKETKDTAFLELRMKFIQVGRGISEQGQNGIMKAFSTFSSFGADPGAALDQLLGTFSNTLGSMISAPVNHTGSMPLQHQNPIPFDMFMKNVTQSGDLQRAKTSIATRSY